MHHLTRLAEQQEVMILNDVCNEQGAVIVPKGRPLDSELAKRLETHKLSTPLEQCVEVCNGVSAAQLLKLYQGLIEHNKDVAVFHERCDLNDLLVEACEYYETFPLLVQKITVLRMVFPQQFKQALFGAYVSLAIAKKMGAGPVDCMNVFLAGLVHDIGVLHLPPELILDKGEYKPEQWKAMQQHTVIAYEILQQVPGLPQSIAKAVLEHHERYDGSGYPYAKRGNDLCMMGQILGMSDTCLALYKRELVGKKLGFDALLPILQLNPDIYCRRVFAATVDLIRDIPWPVKRVYADEKMPEVISRLMVDNEGIQHDYCVLYGLVTSLKPHLPASKKSHMLTRMADRIHQCLQSSGIMQSEHNEWMVISCGAQQTQDYVAIERLEIMYGEIKWQIRQLKRLLYLLWKNQQFQREELNKQVQHGLWQIANYHKQHQSPSVH
jgi:HD-GYP domain-containing protein (c-di-GMP phosphodiesterase class II)